MKSHNQPCVRHVSLWGRSSNLSLATLSPGWRRLLAVPSRNHSSSNFGCSFSRLVTFISCCGSKLNFVQVVDIVVFWSSFISNSSFIIYCPSCSFVILILNLRGSVRIVLGFSYNGLIDGLIVRLNL